MSNIFRATKFQLKMFKPLSLMCLSIIALNVIISVVVNYFLPGSGVSAGSTDSVALIWIFILGILFFIPSFKFMISNAVSRGSLFWANILSMGIISVVWAVTFTMILSLISKMHINMIVIYTLIYKDSSIIGTVVWFIAAFFMLIVIGWFVNMVYYRSDKRMAFVISFAPFVLSGILTIISHISHGKLFEVIIKFIVEAMGLSGSVSNPYIASLSMVFFAAIICVFNYLLIIKAQIKG